MKNTIPIAWNGYFRKTIEIKKLGEKLIAEAEQI
jgi:hypothetical protein